MITYDAPFVIFERVQFQTGSRSNDFDKHGTLGGLDVGVWEDEVIQHGTCCVLAFASAARLVYPPFFGVVCLCTTPMAQIFQCDDASVQHGALCIDTHQLIQ